MECSPGGTFAALNRPSGPDIARPRIDIPPPDWVRRLRFAANGLPWELRTIPLILVIRCGTSAKDAFATSARPTLIVCASSTLIVPGKYVMPCPSSGALSDAGVVAGPGIIIIVSAGVALTTYVPGIRL